MYNVQYANIQSGLGAKLKLPVKCGRLRWWQGKWVRSVDQSGQGRTVHWPYTSVPPARWLKCKQPLSGCEWSP